MSENSLDAAFSRVLFLGLTLLLGACGSLPARLDEANPAARFRSVVDTLTRPEMEGRAPGTAGSILAEDWVASQFRALGLQSFGGTNSFQKVEIPGLSQRNVLSAWGAGCETGVAPIVIGAHLDHLGPGFPGADDNASGIAALLEIARSLKTKESSSCFLFAAFAGEERAIAGSTALIQWLAQIGRLPKAMFNLDMVGRVREQRIRIEGVESASEWTALVQSACPLSGLTCELRGDGYGRSDHAPFYLKKVPVIYAFSGFHPDCHRPSDTADKVNAAGGVQVAELIAALARAAASPNQALTWRRPSPAPGMGAIHSPKRGIGQGAYLGTIPHFGVLATPSYPGRVRQGLPITGVRAGSPADQAGVLEGDELLAIIRKPFARRWLRTKTPDLTHYAEALASLHPGERVALQIWRTGKTLQLRAVVGRRKN